MRYTYNCDPHSGIVAEHPERFGQACEIVSAIPDETDPHPTNDWFRVRFSDDVEITAAPEELEPIPPVGTGR